MQKKEQEVYFAVYSKHGEDDIFLINFFYFGNKHEKQFLTRTFLADPVG